MVFLKRVFLLMIVWPMIAQGQQSFFLDTIFDHDFSDIVDSEIEYKVQQMEWLDKNYGFAVGGNYTKRNQEELDNQSTFRILGKLNILNQGYAKNKMESDILNLEIEEERLLGNSTGINHKYGILYDYIVYMFNEKKMKFINELLSYSTLLSEDLESLYYKKAIEHEDINFIKGIKDQFTLLKATQYTYNSIFFDIIRDRNLPDLDVDKYWAIDFLGICYAVKIDTTLENIIDLNEDIIDLQKKKNSLPNLNLSGGYDLARGEIVYGVNFSYNLQPNQNKLVKLKKTRTASKYKNAWIQKTKEILNLSYEFDFKLKQIKGLLYDINKLNENLHKDNVQSKLNNLNESIEARKLKLNILLKKYELLDLRQMQMLTLLKIKSIIPHLRLEPYIKPLENKHQKKKFVGKRYFVFNESDKMSELDKMFVEYNELEPITYDEMVNIKSSTIIYPNSFKNRLEMESKIKTISSKNKQTKIVFLNFKDLRTLDKKSIPKHTINEERLNHFINN